MSSAADVGSKRSRVSLGALKPLAPYAFAHRARIALALIALAIASAATLVVPIAVRRMIDFGFSDANAGLIRAYFLAMIGVVAVLALASGARYYLVMTLGERVVADLRADLFSHLTRLDPSFFDGEKTGDIASRLSADTTQLKATFGSSASLALRNLFLFVGAITMMVFTSPKLSAFVLAAIPVIVLPLYAAGRSVRERSRRAQDRLADATAFATESLSAVRVMQSFLAEKFTASRYREAAFGAYEAARAMTQARAIVTAAAIFLAFGSVVVVLWLGAQEVIAGAMTGGALSQFVLFAVFGAGALGQLSEVWNEVSQAAGAAGRIGEIMAVKPRIVAPAQPVKLAKPVRGELAFHDVRFAYPGRHDDSVLRDVSFRVAPGETVAIVGPSGAGKSTLFQLALRFYDPGSGAVMLDGVDISKLDPADLRAEIALVPQDAFIFGATVADNIAYGAPGATREAVVAAAKQAAADELHLRHAAGLRHGPGGARRDAVGWRTSADRDRPRHPQRRAGAALGRGDLSPRRRERNAGPGRARNADEGPLDSRDRSPAGDDRQRASHPRHRGGAPRRGRVSRLADGGERPLRASGAASVRDRRRGADAAAAQ